MLGLAVAGVASLMASADLAPRRELRLPPAQALQGAGSGPLAASGPTTIFVNFDGATLKGGEEDARSNSTLIGYQGPFEAYGEGAKRAAVLQAVREDWLAYDATVTDTRPESGDYTMVMVGPTNFTDGSLGIALLDCGNNWTANNVVFAFHDIDDGYTAASTATTIGQEVAHAFGLEHVDAPADIMHPYNVGGDPVFRDECGSVVPAPGIGILCRAQHIESCGEPERQNGHAELLSMIGARPVDLMPPVVRITAPEAEAHFAPHQTFVISVDATDNEEVGVVELLQGDTVVATDDARPFSWQVRGAGSGGYTFVARARDTAGNESRSAPLQVWIGDGHPGGSGESSGGVDTDDSLDFGSTGDAQTGDAESSGGDSDGPPTPYEPSEIPDSEDPFDPFGDACSCRNTSPLGLHGLLLWCLPLLLRRRRPTA